MALNGQICFLNSSECFLDSFECFPPNIWNVMLIGPLGAQFVVDGESIWGKGIQDEWIYYLLQV